jgi:DNA (cytosine-5)-methyltransferase 1
VSLIAIDAFSGCGGLSQGLKAAGFSVRAAIEINEKARAVYNLNHPEVPVFADIRAAEPAHLADIIGLKPFALDLLAGCPPCQGFSRLRSLNRSKVIMDPRNDLIFDLLRLVKYFKPKTILIENVPDLLLDQRINVFTETIAGLGYSWDAKIVDAANYGVPQRRKRMILVASRLGKISVNPSNHKCKTVGDVIKQLPHPTKSKNDLHHLTSKHSRAVYDRIKRIPKNGGSRLDLSYAEQLPCHQNKHTGFKDIYGRMSWDSVAPTLTKYCTNPSKGRFLHPTQNRAITLFEAALLQSFPKSYKFDASLGRTAIAAMIGEAIPPLMAKAHAKLLIDHIQDYKLD